MQDQNEHADATADASKEQAVENDKVQLQIDEEAESRARLDKLLKQIDDARAVVEDKASYVILPAMPRSIKAKATEADGSAQRLRYVDFDNNRHNVCQLQFRRRVSTVTRMSSEELKLVDYLSSHVLLHSVCPAREVQHAETLSSSGAPLGTVRSATQTLFDRKGVPEGLGYLATLDLKPASADDAEATLGFAKLLVLEEVRCQLERKRGRWLSPRVFGDPSDDEDEDGGVRSQLHGFYDNSIRQTRSLARGASALLDEILKCVADAPKEDRIVSLDHPVFASSSGRGARIALQQMWFALPTSQGGVELRLDLRDAFDSCKRVSRVLAHLGAAKQYKLHPVRWPIAALQTLERSSSVCWQGDDLLSAMRRLALGPSGVHGEFALACERVRSSCVVCQVFYAVLYDSTRIDAADDLVYKLAALPVPGWWLDIALHDLAQPKRRRKARAKTRSPTTVVDDQHAVDRAALHHFWKMRVVSTGDGHGSTLVLRASFGDHRMGLPLAGSDASFAATRLRLRRVQRHLEGVLLASAPPKGESPRSSSTLDVGACLRDFDTLRVSSTRDVYVTTKEASAYTVAATLSPMNAFANEERVRWALWTIDRLAQVVALATALDSSTLYLREVPFESEWLAVVAVALAVSESLVVGTHRVPKLQLTLDDDDEDVGEQLASRLQTFRTALRDVDLDTEVTVGELAVALTLTPGFTRAAEAEAKDASST